MAFLAPMIGTISTVASVGGTILTAAGAIQQGREEKARAMYEQKVQQQQADEAQASSQRDAIEQRRQGNMIMSQQRAALAGSGGNMTDPSVIDLMGDTNDKVQLAVDTETYKGEQQARGFNDAAKVAGVNAANAMRAARLKAVGSIFDGVSSMYSRFGEPQKKPTEASNVQLPYGSAPIRAR